MPNWRDTLTARAHGLVEGFHDHNATHDEIAAAEQAARDRDRPEAAHAVAEATTPVVDGGPTEADTLARLAEAPLDAGDVDEPGPPYWSGS